MCVHKDEERQGYLDLVTKYTKERDDIERLQSEVLSIKTKHESFNETLKSVIENLQNNNIIKNRPFDDGKLTDDYTKITNFIAQSEDVLTKCTAKIEEKNNEINTYQRKANHTNGDCWACIKKKWFG